MKQIPLFLSFFITLMASASAQVQANDWPSKTVRILVPYAPGGPSDTLGRMVAQQLQNSLKQSFIEENRGGGGGTI